MTEACYGCSTPYKPGAVFCAKCGARRDPLRAEPAFSLRATFVLYFTLLAIGITAAGYAKVTERAFEPTVAGSIAIAVVALVAAISARTLVGPSLRTLGLSLRGYGLVVLAAPLIVALVVLYANGLRDGLHLQLESELHFLEGHSVVWAVVVLVVLAPVGEELAFRGLVFPGLARSLGLTEAYAITAFAFGILHLAVPSLVTHVPLGLYFCWLRHRSGSLWPPLLAHALHNLGVLLYELS